MYYCFRCEWYEVKANLMKGDFGEGKYRYWCATVIIAVCFITYYHRHKKFFISNIFDILKLMFIDLIKSLLSLDLRKYLFIFIVLLKTPSNNRFLRVAYLALRGQTYITSFRVLANTYISFWIIQMHLVCDSKC